MKIVEIFDSIQGEGMDTGLSATFIRLHGCNMTCSFCDTDWVTQSEKLHVSDILLRCTKKLVVITGGEPLLQAEELLTLCMGLRLAGKKIGLETNGTLPLGSLEGWFDSISISPKVPRNRLAIPGCHSLKLLYPYLKGASPADYHYYPFKQGFIQPIDGVENSLQGAINEVIKLNSPFWKLGIQLHKYINMR